MQTHAHSRSDQNNSGELFAVLTPCVKNHPPTFASWRARQALAIALLGLTAAWSARAQSASEDSTLFGMFGQLNAGVTVVNAQPINVNACVPTATVDGLAYLYNYANSESQPAPLSFAPSYTSVNNVATAMGTFNNTYYQYYNAANALVYTSVNARNDAAAAALGATTFATRPNIGGTPTYNMYNGLQSYLSAGGANPSPMVSISGLVGGATPAGWLSGALNGGLNNVANGTPTAQYLANNLNAHNAVELTLEWGIFNGNTWVSQGGHEVLLWSINLGNGGTGTIQYLDPYGTTAGGMTANLVLNADGYLYGSGFTVTPADDNPPDLVDGAPGAGGPTQYFRIDDVMVESVPEPATFGLFGAIGSLLVMARRSWVQSRRAA
jgi:hypothetical protein